MNVKVTFFRCFTLDVHFLCPTVFSLNMESVDSEKFRNLLLYDKSTYKIIPNEFSSATLWWRSSGFPVRLDENDELERIHGFISCFKRMNTQVYNTLSGTKRYKQHADHCFRLSKTGQPTSSASSTSPSSSTLPLAISFTSAASSSTQTTLNHMGFTKRVRFNDKDVTKLKDLSVK